MKRVGHPKAAVKRLRDWHAKFAIVLGSGLGAIVPDTDDAFKISYPEFAELPQTSVPGHTGRFVLAEINQVRIIFAQGRVHSYEGFSARDVTAGVRLFAEAGIKNVILTNAAGSTNLDFAPGSWMMIKDHINLTGTTPLIGAPNFVDLTTAYSPRLREQFARAAEKIGMPLHEGIYAGLLGPQYETPAEVRMLQKLGADAIGMSTVLEVIQARALGMEVAAFSCLTNFAAGTSVRALTHQEVLQTGNAAAANFTRLLNTALQ
jgi:purine-nucleoside phosphorylase